MGYYYYRLKRLYWRVFDRERHHYECECERMAHAYYTQRDAFDAALSDIFR